MAGADYASCGNCCKRMIYDPDRELRDEKMYCGKCYAGVMKHLDKVETKLRKYRR